jgi:hypothetical protein
MTKHYEKDEHSQDFAQEVDEFIRELTDEQLAEAIRREDRVIAYCVRSARVAEETRADAEGYRGLLIVEQARRERNGGR